MALHVRTPTTRFVTFWSVRRPRPRVEPARPSAALRPGASLAPVSAGPTHSVKRHLDVDAEGYDVQIRRLIPHYDEMISTGVEVLRALASADAHVLDLGGGTGALSAAVLEGLPSVRVTLLDVDPDMLAEARRRLARFADRVNFQEGSFHDPLTPADAVIASLALHHVHDLETKTELYRRIRDALPPGGVLLNLDAAVSEGPRLNRLVFDRMAERMGDHGITGAEAREHFAAWAKEDRYFPLDAELGAFRAAGFDEVECVWRRALSAITCALRAPRDRHP
jgi:tRNA (cmo5U34)-methyltransferase